MNIAAKHFCLLLSVVALTVAGCTSPVRPTPQQTVLGPRTGGPGIDPRSIPTDLGTDLRPRGLDGEFDANNQLRGRLEPIYFALDRSSIEPAERTKIEAAVKMLQDNPNYRLLLEGHADWRGTAEYNLGLGDRRSVAVRDLIKAQGIAAERLEILSKGSLEAKANADEATMAKDRRVEQVLVR